MKRKLKERINQINGNIAAVFLTLSDKDTPLSARIVAAVTIAYALSPVDLIPDFIPILGYLDDLVILPLLIVLTIKLVPKDVWERNKAASADMWKDGKPQKWYYAIPIVLIWLVIVAIAVRIIWFFVIGN